jgi:hypothetical protein
MRSVTRLTSDFIDMSAMSKLQFLGKYGSEKHKAAIPAKIDHEMSKVKTDVDHMTDDEEIHGFTMAQSPLVKGKHLDKLVSTNSSYIREGASMNPNLQPHHVDAIIAHDKSGNSTNHIIRNKNVKMNSDQLHKAIDHPGDSHPASWISDRVADLNDSHWDKLARHNQQGAALTTLSHMPKKHLKTAAEHNPNKMVRNLAQAHYEDRESKGR